MAKVTVNLVDFQENTGKWRQVRSDGYTWLSGWEPANWIPWLPRGEVSPEKGTPVLRELAPPTLTIMQTVSTVSKKGSLESSGFRHDSSKVV